MTTKKVFSIILRIFNIKVNASQKL